MLLKDSRDNPECIPNALGQIGGGGAEKCSYYLFTSIFTSVKGIIKYLADRMVVRLSKMLR